MKKRLIALLLVVATMLSLMGSTVPTSLGEGAVSEGEAVIAEKAVAAVTEDTGDEFCTECESILVDGTYCHADDCVYAYDGDAAQVVGKYIAPLDNGYVFVSENCSDGDIFFAYEEFREGTVFRVTDWYWNNGNTAVWFKVDIHSGGIVDEYADLWPAEAWVLYDYTDSSDPSFEFVTVEQPEESCHICGEVDCDKVHIYCDVCDKYDCGLSHIYCHICGAMDCTVSHKYCGICGEYDCGVEHEDGFRPITAPVIPDYTLPEDVEFAVVDGNGSVVGETGIVLPAGKQMSLSAWTHLENAAYQWQVRYDHENDLWTDIQGKTGKGILFSAAMLLSVVDANSVAYLRFVASNGTDTVTSDAVAITVQNKTNASSGSSETEAVAVDLPEAQAEGDEVKQRHTISIQYVYENGSMASATWSAKLAEGDVYSHTFTMPTVVGYKPTGTSDDIFVVDEAAGTVTVNVGADSLKEDRTLIITYVPDFVEVTILHYLQNTTGNGYAEPISEVSTEYITDETVDGTPQSRPMDSEEKTVLHNTYEGFYNLRYTETEAAAANGSTEIEIYYDRYYYLINFNLGGGYGVEPIYDRYGATIGNIGTPTRPGYTFAGWQLNGVDADIPDTVPVNGGTYVAKWTPQDTEYSVVYWIKNDDGSETYVGTQIVGAQSGAVVSGSDDLTINTNTCGMPQHTHGIDCGPTCGLDEHTHGDGYCIYNCGETYHDHTYGCNYGCGQAVHTTHTRSCYNFTSGANIATSATNIYSNTTYNYNGFTVYRTGWDNYSYYVRIGNSYYQITNFGSTLNADDLRYTLNDELHVHGADCCSVAYHVHEGCICNVTPHLHGAGCHTCVALEHTHSDACKSDLAKYVDYVRADENVTVAGDGSSVVNVYYKYRTYTIRYIYARRYNNNYWVATLTNDGRLNNCQWTNVNNSNLPTVTDPDGRTGNNTVVIDGVTYYYISLTAKFGENIADRWPGGNVGNFAGYTWGSWAAAAGTGYRITYGNEHANIVGPYPVMSADMIVDNPELLETRADGTKVYLAQNMIAWWAGSNNNVANHAYHNYFELLPGETQVAGQTYKTYNGKTYKLVETYTFTAAHNGSTRVDPIYFNGYRCVNDTSGTNNDRQSNSSNFNNNGRCSICGSGCRYCNDFFYDRNDHKLYFWNHNGYLQEGSGIEVVYGEALTEYGTQFDNAFMNQPENYPEGLEPGAYEFAGWYTTADCLDGTEVDWDTITMPDSDMTIYAKWEAVTRTVRFYLDKEDMLDGNTIPEKLGNADRTDPYSVKFADKEVPNNTLLGDEYHPGVAETGGADHKYKEVTFVGWFYMDGNEEKAFDPEAMRITEDLELFAKWTSDKLCDVTVYYVLGDANGNRVVENGQYVHVAEPIHTSGLLYSTKTFDAKTNAQLYDAYRSGYYPNTASASITIGDPDMENPPPELNTIYFVYKEMQTVPYTVRYIIDFGNGVEKPLKADGEGGYVVPDETDTNYTEYKKYISDNKASVVTENFVFVEGYMPDAYQKRMTLSTNADENVITFYYSVNEIEAMYQVIHYTQSADGEGWVEYQVFSGMVGNIGERQKVSPMSINGYEFNAEITDAENVDPVEDFGSVEAGYLTAVLPANGMVMKLYYVRPTELSVGKIVNVEEAGTGTPEVSEFEFTVHFPTEVADGTAVEYTVTGSADTKTAQVKDHKVVIMLKNGQTARFKDLPVGTYAVEEKDYSGYGYSAFCSVNKGQAKRALKTEDFSLAYGKPVDVVFYNKFPVGNLQITKTVTKEWAAQNWTGDEFIFVIERTAVQSGEPRPLDDNTAYSYWLDGDDDKVMAQKPGNGKLRVSIPFNAEEAKILEENGSVTRTLTIIDLIAGTYTVTEDENSEVEYSYTTTTAVGTQKAAVNNVEVPVETGTSVVGFINQLKRAEGSLYLEKELIPAEGFNPDELPQGTKFSFTVQLMDEPPATKTIRLAYGTDAAMEVTMTNGIFQLQLEAGQYVNVTGLPIGEYRITEATKPYYANSFALKQNGAWTAMTTTSDKEGRMYADVDVAANAKTEVKCTNTYPVNRAELVLQKLVTKENDRDVLPEDTFTFTVVLAETDLQSYNYTIYNQSGDVFYSDAVAVENKTFSLNLTQGQYAVVERMPVCGYTVTESVGTNGLGDYNVSYAVYQHVMGDSASTTVDTSGVILETQNANTVTRTFAAGITDTIVFTNEYKAQVADLTITKTGWNVIDENQSFIFTVSGEGINMDVVINGNSSVTIEDLPIGTYTVTEKTSWSWRYTPTCDPDDGKITLTANGKNEIKFNNSRSKIYWLNGGAYERNLFNGSNETN